MIDLRSDTLTKPTEAMRNVMLEAEVGDDAYREDNNVIALEAYCAELFQKEDAVFMPSGTMSNQIALRVHTQPGDEVILDSNYHIHFYESAPSADLAKVTLNHCNTADGVLTVEIIDQLIQSKYRSSIYSSPKLICVENTIGNHAGKVFPFEELFAVYQYAQEKGIRVHQDGARIMNASVASGISPKQYGSVCDTLSLCFAKGLGAPFGSILMGTRKAIQKARMYRKWYGGTLHQSGHYAAAALYAIQHHLDQLAVDHENAKQLALLLSNTPGLYINMEDVQTNMVFMDISKLGVSQFRFVELVKQEGVLLFPLCTNTVRAVTQMGVSTDDIIKAAEIIRKVCYKLMKKDVIHT